MLPPRRRWVLPSQAVPWVRGLVFAALLGPLLRALQLGVQGVLDSGPGLGTDPIRALTHRTGEWAMYSLLLSLSITPLRRLSHQQWLIKLRRPLGLYAFFYGSLHLALYLFDQGFAKHDAPQLQTLVADVVKRPFVLPGALALLLLVPLAVTSTAGWMRRLGRSWQTLHRLAYAAALLSVLHWTWLAKPGARKPVLFGVGLFALLGMRAWSWRRHVLPAAGPSDADPES